MIIPIVPKHTEAKRIEEKAEREKAGFRSTPNAWVHRTTGTPYFLFLCSPLVSRELVPLPDRFIVSLATSFLVPGRTQSY